MNELYHHGVKGMRWGHRKAQIQIAKMNYKNAKKKAFDKYEKSIENIEKSYKRGQNLSDEDINRETKVELDYKNEISKAKADYKNARAKANLPVVRNAVNAYKKASYIGTGIGTAIAGIAVASLATSVAARNGKAAAVKYGTQALGIISIAAATSMASTKIGAQVINRMLDRKEEKLNNKK